MKNEMIMTESVADNTEYFAQRQLKKGAVGWLLLVGLGVSYVISGDFAGWNFGIAQGGWGGLFVATIVVAFMYLCMSLSMSEMSTMLPTAGGGYSFARVAFGQFGGYLTGTAILIEYAVAPAAIAVFIGNYCEALFGIGGWPIYLFCYVFFMAIHLQGAGEALKPTSPKAKKHKHKMSNKHLHLKERRRMKLKTLTTAMILATVPMTGAFAAALDRSGQSISAFLQPGNYFEAGISVLDPDVSGKAISTAGGGNLSDMGDDYYFPSAALKLQVTDHFSFGLIYDQPFGADAAYSTSDPLVGLNTGLFHLNGEATEVEVDTQSLSMIFGFQPNENFNIYAGPVYQTIKGNVQLRGAAYGSANGLGLYNADLDEDGAVGWLAGFDYQIPEIALKTSITYRSEIDHKPSAREYGQSNVLAFVGSSPVYDVATDANITTPQSVNLDFQTGIMANTVAFANVRWVNWKDFSIDLKQFGTVADTLGALGQTPDNPNGFDIVGYTDDQWSANVGVGRKFNDLWAGNVSVGWDSGAGNPVETLGPTEGYWNVGLGLQYSPTPATFIAGGVKYFWLGDAKAQVASNFGSDTYVAEFNDNDALAYGLKIGYKF